MKPKPLISLAFAIIAPLALSTTALAAGSAKTHPVKVPTTVVVPGPKPFVPPVATITSLSATRTTITVHFRVSTTSIVGVTGYQALEGAAINEYSPPAVWAPVSPSARVITITNLRPNTKYYVEVETEGGEAPIAWSAPWSYTTS
jgi:hypothetical protein